MIATRSLTRWLLVLWFPFAASRRKENSSRPKRARERASLMDAWQKTLEYQANLVIGGQED
jgi:hypothetical protein